MKRLFKLGESGEANATALMLLVLASLWLVPMLKLSSTSLNHHHVIERKTAESYAADSGVEYVLGQIGNNPTPYQQGTVQDSLVVGPRTANMTTQYMGNNVYKIVSTAATGDISSTSIQVYVHVGDSLFDFGIAATDGDMVLTGGVEEGSGPVSGQGDVYANGNIIVSGHVSLDGDATASGSVSVDKNATITGSTQGGVPPYAFHNLDASTYLYEANQGGIIEGNLNLNSSTPYYLGPKHITGNLSLSSNQVLILTGTVYVDGTINVSAGARIEGACTIVANGDIHVTGSGLLSPGNLPLIISLNGNINVAGSSWTSAVLYAPNGDISMGGSSKLYGSMIGKSIHLSGNAQITYPLELKSQGSLPGGGAMTVLSHN